MPTELEMPKPYLLEDLLEDIKNTKHEKFDTFKSFVEKQKIRKNSGLDGYSEGKRAIDNYAGVYYPEFLAKLIKWTGV